MPKHQVSRTGVELVDIYLARIQDSSLDLSGWIRLVHVRRGSRHLKFPAHPTQGSRTCSTPARVFLCQYMAVRYGRTVFDSVLTP
eukprot:SAG11_NODE_6756_length_1253_cov_1.708839_2_plen_85_part_00